MNLDFLNRHEKIAFELSGGKDSVACLYLLRDQLHKMTVYWLNTGDTYPETRAIIAQCREMCPFFVEVKSDVYGFHHKHGFPSDVIPDTGYLVHQEVAIKTVSQYACCAHNIMLPLHNKVVEDGNTCIVRGQKAADTHKSPAQSGGIYDGIEMVFPVEGWTDEQVMGYLIDNEAPIHPCYQFTKDGVDCMHCTGWWKKTPLQFLERHVDAYMHVTNIRKTIRLAVEEGMKKC